MYRRRSSHVVSALTAGVSRGFLPDAAPNTPLRHELSVRRVVQQVAAHDDLTRKPCVIKNDGGGGMLTAVVTCEYDARLHTAPSRPFPSQDVLFCVSCC
jgi:hypothetical protein